MQDELASDMAETNSYIAVCLRGLFQSLPPFSSLRKLLRARVIPWEVGKKRGTALLVGMARAPCSCSTPAAPVRLLPAGDQVARRWLWQRSACNMGILRWWCKVVLNLLCRTSSGSGVGWGCFFSRFQNILNGRKTPHALLMAFSLV